MDVLISINEILEGCARLFDVVWEIPKYEEELKYMTAAALVCYGGSWTTLAGIFAAADAFDLKKTADQAKEIGAMLLSGDDEFQHDVSPGEIKACFKNLGLHIALMVSVV